MRNPKGDTNFTDYHGRPKGPADAGSPRGEIRNPSGNGNERLLRFLQATPDQQVAIDRILEGKVDREPEPPRGPLLMMIKDAAALLGVHRATIWRLVKAGRLEPVMLLGAVRVRRADVEALACPLAQEIRSPAAVAEIRNPKTEIRGQLEGVAR